MGFLIGTVDTALNRLRIGFIADLSGTGLLLPPIDQATREIPIARVFLKHNLDISCDNGIIAPLDTTTLFFASDTITLELVNKSGQGYKPVVDKDSIEVLRHRSGDCDLNSILTISDAVCMISYIFSGGQPECSDAIDSDCNHMATISDAVYLINYIFASGPVPGATCTCGL